MPVYMTCANMLVLGRAEAPQSIKHVDTWRIHGETDVTWRHGSRQSHRGDHAYCITWICTYNKCLEHIFMPQGPEHPWPERVAHVTTRVHHTKWTITHTHESIYTYIYIYIYTYIYHAQCYHTESKSKTDIANIPRVWPNKVQEMSNKHYHIQGMRPKQRARKRKGTSKGGTLIHTLLKRFRERERKKKPPRKG